MPGDTAGGTSIGSALGRAIGSSVKKTSSSSGSSVGRSVGRSVKANTSSRSSSGVRRNTSSGGSSYSGNSSSSGRSSGRSSGGGGGSSYVAPKAPVVPKPPAPPSLASYLGTDSVYQQTISGGKRSLADFLSEMGRRRGEAGTQYNQTTASMEKDRTQQLDDLRNEFASRGLIQSGLYGEEQGKFQQKFTEQQNALSQQQTGLLADLLGQEKNYRRENDNATAQAKQDAILRRAQKYNLT
jgi:hypothetical protein